MSRYQKGKNRKGKTNLDLLEQEIVSGSGISWAICKSAPHPRQLCQHPTTQFFTGRMPFLPPNQQRQSTEVIVMYSVNSCCQSLTLLLNATDIYCFTMDYRQVDDGNLSLLWDSFPTVCLFTVMLNSDFESMILISVYNYVPHLFSS